jgi:hypothetical protein
MDDPTDPPGTPPTPPPMPSPPPDDVRGVPLGTGPVPSPVAGGSVRTGALLMLIGGLVVILGAFLPWFSVSAPGGTRGVGGLSGIGFGLVFLAGFAIAKGAQGLLPSLIRMRLSAPILTGALMIVALAIRWSDLHRTVDLVDALPGVTASIGIGFWLDAVGVVAVLLGGAILQFGDRS